VGFRDVRESTLADYLVEHPELFARLGGRPAAWRIEEVSYGPLSRVLIAVGPEGAVCVKQALPYGQLTDEAMPLPLDRMAFEEGALNLYARLAPDLVPRVLMYDSERCLLVMEHLAAHVPLSRLFADGTPCPTFPADAARFLAEILFRTSDLGMAGVEKRERMAYFGGKAELIKVIEGLIFVEPYIDNPRNRWTSPHLDDLVAELRADAELRHAVALLGLKFLAEPQALIHGGLDLDAFLVTADDVRVIDPKFAIFGPIGFDVGTVLGHLLLAHFAQAGTDVGAWALEAIESVWRGFQDHFLGLWRVHHAGDAFPPALFVGPDGQKALELAQADFMRSVFVDSLRFAAAAMISRTIGHFPATEFEAIEDPEFRAAAERRALLLARELLKDAHHVHDLGEVTAVAREL
jgi:5-methylthioribose kinase